RTPLTRIGEVRSQRSSASAPLLCLCALGFRRTERRRRECLLWPPLTSFVIRAGSSSVRRGTFCMTGAEKPFPVLFAVLWVEAFSHVVNSDYRPDSRATNLKSEGRMAAPRVNALAAGLDPLRKRTFHVARSAIRTIRSINKSRGDFLVSFEQSGRQS